MALIPVSWSAVLLKQLSNQWEKKKAKVSFARTLLVCQIKLLSSIVKDGNWQLKPKN